jgi:hypothetical protein
MPYGNGVSLWFEIDGFEACATGVAGMGVAVVRPRHRDPQQGPGCPNLWQTVVLASSDGTVGPG